MIGRRVVGAAGALTVLLATTQAASSAEPAPAVVAKAAATRIITPVELATRLGKPDPALVVLDVRTPAEFNAGHVPGAINIPHDEVRARLAELAASRNHDVVLYCRSGRRSQLAAQVLVEAGFTSLLQLAGDYPGWEADGHEVERSATAED